MSPGSSLIDVGVDYLTLVSTTEKSTFLLSSKAELLLRSQRRQGSKIKGWSSFGYSGFQAQGIQFGGRHDGCIVRLSGELARDEWWSFYEVADKITRVDLQATVKVNISPHELVARHYKQAKRKWRGRRDGPTLTYIQDTNRGATLYVGKRSSDVMFRIYNKEVESGDPRYESCVRYEGEFKNVAGPWAIAPLCDGKLVAPAVCNCLNQMLSARGVVPWLPTGYIGLKIRPQKAPTDAERKLQWLEQSIRPTVNFLLDYYPREVILKALGLSDLA
jgi:DNA relaxase NicK